MEPTHKKILKAISLELRALLEGGYDTDYNWHAGDLERRFAAIGIRRDRDPVPVDELPHLTVDDKHARKVVNAYLEIRRDAGIKQPMAVAEFVRETAYTWANRLLALRCMEARELIDEVILQKEVYGGRSLEHHRLAQRHPKLCTGDDDGLFAVLDKVFTERAETLPLLFDPKSPGVALKPTAAALKRCVALLSGTVTINGQNVAETDVFKAADALGWAYQYWNTEEKDRVFETVRTQKGAKIEGADIIPATQLYTEPYMVKFLVQNSLGKLWMGIHPKSKLCEKWEYYIHQTNCEPIEYKYVSEITLIDPACGSGHFLLEAFDLFYEMYIEENIITDPGEICQSVLDKNLFGIDIDERAVQIAEAVLWMKAAETSFDFLGIPKNLIATNICLPVEKDHLSDFLKKYPEHELLKPALEGIFEALEHINELGSLLPFEEAIDEELKILKRTHSLFVNSTNWMDWKRDVIVQLRDHFSIEAVSKDLTYAFFNKSAQKGLLLFDYLSRRYDVVTSNPPYMGSKYMGDITKRTVRKYFMDEKADIYACFISRCLSLCLPAGFVSMVTRKTWMLITSFKDMRKKLVKKTAVSLVADLGSHAFDQENKLHQEVVVALFILRNQKPIASHQILSTQITSPMYPHKKAKTLRYNIKNSSNFAKAYQGSFTSIPNNPILYNVKPRFLELLDSDERLLKYDPPHDGMTTGDNKRFLRYFWEVFPNDESRWVQYSKGGGYKKWYGNNRFVCDWHQDGVRIKNHPRSYVRNEQRYFKNGLTYSLTGNGSLGIRIISDSAFDPQSPSFFPKLDKFSIMGVLNSRLATFLVRLMTPRSDFNGGYVGRLPILKKIINPEFEQLASFCVELKKAIESENICERSFSKSISWEKEKLNNFGAAILNQTQRYACMVAWLLTAESLIDFIVFNTYSIGEEDSNHVIKEVSPPPGWHTNIVAYQKIEDDCSALPLSPPEILKEYVMSRKVEVLDSNKLNSIKKSLNNILKESPNSPERSDDTQEKSKCWNNPIGKEFFFETLCNNFSLNPLSIYSIIKEEFVPENLVWRSKEFQILLDELTIIILSVLGYQWPLHFDDKVKSADDEVSDGIIPIFGGTGHKTFIEIVRNRISSTFPEFDTIQFETTFKKIINKPLNLWLETGFFRHHTNQFKKRPIIWQLQSAKFTTKKKPTFSCYIFYNRLNADTLPKIRTQYVGPLIKRNETELRGIEAISLSARSDRQEKRRFYLGDCIRELKDFDLRLKEIIEKGFNHSNLKAMLENEDLDKWTSIDSTKNQPLDSLSFCDQETRYLPDINDGVRVNIAPIQQSGVLAYEVLSKKDVTKAIIDRSNWRANDRDLCRKGKLSSPGWWSR